MAWTGWLRRRRSAPRPGRRTDPRADLLLPGLTLRRLEPRRVLSVTVLDAQSFTVAENSPSGTVVGAVQVDTAGQPDPAVEFSIANAQPTDPFSIDPTTGELLVQNPAALNFELTPVFVVEVIASQGGPNPSSDSAIVTIHLGDVYALHEASFTGPAATLSLQGGRLELRQGPLTFFSAPAEDVSALVIRGDSGSNTLTVDLATSNPLPADGLTFDGLSQAGPGGDALVILGGAFQRISTTHLTADDGLIRLDAGGWQRTIEFRGLEAATHTGTVVDAEFILPPTDNHAVLEDLGNGQLWLFSGAGTFGTSAFSIPSGSVAVRGGGGADRIEVAPLGGSLSVNVDGGPGSNTLVIDQRDPPLAAPLFRFAGFTFDQTDTPDLAAALVGTPAGGMGVTLTASPGPASGAAGFPESAAGFQSAQSVGRLLNPPLTGARAVSLPLGNNGATDRAGIELAWSGGRTLTNQPGRDFVIYELADDADGPEGAMVQVRQAGGAWTGWFYRPAEEFAAFVGSPGGAFVTQFDLDDFGLGPGAAIDAIRYVNLTAADRIDGPGAERTPGSGAVVGQGFVLPGDDGATSGVRPDPGPLAVLSLYGPTTLDPDPLYVAVLHPLSGPAAPIGQDEVTIGAAAVSIRRDGAAQPTIHYTSFAALEVYARGGDDVLRVQAGGGPLPASILLDGGGPGSGDRAVIESLSGSELFVLHGDRVEAGGAEITLARIEALRFELGAAGAGDTVAIHGPPALGGTAPRIDVAGGAGQPDELLVKTETAPSPPAAATADQVAIDSDSVDVAGWAAIGYTGLDRVTVETGGGADHVAATPAAGTAIHVDAGAPGFEVYPGDRVTLRLAGAVDPVLTVVEAGGGLLTTTGNRGATFAGVDHFDATAAYDLSFSSAAHPIAGPHDVLRAAREADDLRLEVNGAAVFRGRLAAIDELTAAGTADHDRLVLDFAGGSPIPLGGAAFNASGPGTDELLLVGGAFAAVEFDFTAAGSGQVRLSGQTVGFAGVDALEDTLAAGTRRLNYLAADNALVFQDHPTAGLSRVSGNHAPTVRFANPATLLELRAGPGDDEVLLEGLDAGFRASLSIQGQTGYDTLRVDAPLVLGSALSDGAIDFAAEEIALSAAIDTTAGAAGTVTLHAAARLSMTAAADVAAGGAFLQTGPLVHTAANVTTTGGLVSWAGNATLTGSVEIRTGAGGGDVRFLGQLNAAAAGGQDLRITAGTGDVRFAGLVGNAAPLGDVTIVSARDVDVLAAFAARTLTQQAGSGLTTLAGAAALSAATGVGLDLTAPGLDLRAAAATAGAAARWVLDELAIDPVLGSLDVTAAGIATIAARTPGRAIDLGTNTAGRLAITDAELDRITAGTLRIGSAASGPIDVSAAVSPGGAGALRLTTGAGIGGGGSLIAAALALEAQGPVALAGPNDAGTLAAAVWGAGQSFAFRDVSGLHIGAVDGVAGLVLAGGAATLDAAGGLTQSASGPIIAGGLELLSATSVILALPTNNVVALAGNVAGPVEYRDAHALTIGTVHSVGLSTMNAPVRLHAGGPLLLVEPIHAGTALAALRSDAGGIDSGGGPGAKVVAGSLALRTTGGVGNAQPLRTTVAAVAGSNLGAGGWRVVNFGAPTLTVGAVDGLAGVVNAGGGGIALTQTGALDVVRPVVELGGGSIALTTLADGGADDHLTVSALVAAAGGSGGASFTAGDDLRFLDAGLADDVVTQGAGVIRGVAGRDVTIGPDVRLRSATGAITALPPRLENLTGPQVLNTGQAQVAFDYGRLLERGFTAFVDWSDGAVDVLPRGLPGALTAFHVYVGNPNLANPAAPILVTVTLRLDDHIDFPGYNTTTLAVVLSVPGEGLLPGVRIDTTPKVPELAAPAAVIVSASEGPRAALIETQQVLGGGAATRRAAVAGERFLLLREVLPDGRAGDEVQLDERLLTRLAEVFRRLPDGRYRLYRVEDDGRTARLVADVELRGGRPAAPGELDGGGRDRPPGDDAPHEAAAPPTPDPPRSSNAPPADGAAAEAVPAAPDAPPTEPRTAGPPDRAAAGAAAAASGAAGLVGAGRAGGAALDARCATDRERAVASYRPASRWRRRGLGPNRPR